jgi:hypothetical protein
MSEIVSVLTLRLLVQDLRARLSAFRAKTL